jgi:hypothetical protein
MTFLVKIIWTILFCFCFSITNISLFSLQKKNICLLCWKSYVYICHMLYVKTSKCQGIIFGILKLFSIYLFGSWKVHDLYRMHIFLNNQLWKLCTWVHFQEIKINYYETIFMANIYYFAIKDNLYIFFVRWLEIFS